MHKMSYRSIITLLAITCIAVRAQADAGITQAPAQEAVTRAANQVRAATTWGTWESWESWSSWSSWSSWNSYRSYRTQQNAQAQHTQNSNQQGSDNYGNTYKKQNLADPGESADLNGQFNNAFAANGRQKNGEEHDRPDGASWGSMDNGHAFENTGNAGNAASPPAITPPARQAGESERQQGPVSVKSQPVIPDADTESDINIVASSIAPLVTSPIAAQTGLQALAMAANDETPNFFSDSAASKIGPITLSTTLLAAFIVSLLFA